MERYLITNLFLKLTCKSTLIALTLPVLLTACGGKVQLEDDPPTPFCEDKAKKGYALVSYNEIGSGTAEDPFALCTAAQLQDLGSKQTDLNKAFILKDNIDMTGVSLTPIGSATSPFSGDFDGNEYAIKNLTINLPTTNAVGIFSYSNGATFKDLALENVNIIGQDYVGALVGNAEDTNFENVVITGQLTGEAWVGALAGYLLIEDNNAVLKKIYTETVVTGVGLIGGCIGEIMIYTPITIEFLWITGEVR